MRRRGDKRKIDQLNLTILLNSWVGFIQFGVKIEVCNSVTKKESDKTKMFTNWTRLGDYCKDTWQFREAQENGS